MNNDQLHLINIVEVNLDDCPEPVKAAFRSMQARSGAIIIDHCDVNGDIDPTCVWDDNTPTNCVHAENGIKKADCPHWVTK